jgi:hypothetical protein
MLLQSFGTTSNAHLVAYVCMYVKNQLIYIDSTYIHTLAIGGVKSLPPHEISPH